MADWSAYWQWYTHNLIVGGIAVGVTLVICGLFRLYLWWKGR